MFTYYQDCNQKDVLKGPLFKSDLNLVDTFQAKNSTVWAHNRGKNNVFQYFYSEIAFQLTVFVNNDRQYLTCSYSSIISIKYSRAEIVRHLKNYSGNF